MSHHDIGNKYGMSKNFTPLSQDQANAKIARLATKANKNLISKQLPEAMRLSHRMVKSAR